MQVGIRLPHFKQVALDPAQTAPNVLVVARRAEELGFDSLWVGDHIVPPAGTLNQFGTVWYEALTTLAYVASATSRVRLGTAVLVTPYRHPVLLGKMLATLDSLSGGRLDAGFGTGWLEPEFKALGLDSFADRGAVTDDALRTMKAMWCGEGIGVTTDDGGDYMFSPRPVQPSVPIWIGGNSKRAARRVAELGDGWMTVRPTFEEFEGMVGHLRGLCERADRDPASIRLAVEQPFLLSDEPVREAPFLGSADRIVDQLSAYAALGADSFLFDMFYSAPENEHVGVPEMLEEMQRFAEEIRPKLGT
ncbi:LLM class F420-dependent oxidoreductase [Actinophytocola sp.]|uniref:LLM class F420-dependent oxidoreductase n=1 Tax=Actinophytocola sp. TaxID=1872138 RepID=UPI003D6C3D9E